MRRHALSLAALLALSCAVQACCVLRAVAPAQDAVRFVLAAKTIQRSGLRTMLRDEPGHPLFPALVWAAHGLLAPWLGMAPDAWPTSAQVAAAVPLVLSVLPAYGFLLCVVRWRAALAGTIFFCVIPAVARLGADGISDSTHLCLLCAALWAAAKYWRHWPQGSERSHAAAWLVLAGGASALAALARKEALIFLSVMGGVLVLLQCCAAWRQPWKRVVSSGLSLAVGASVVWFPYLLAAGAVQPRHAIARLLGQPRPMVVPAAMKKKPMASRSSRWRTADGNRMDFAKKDPQTSLRFRGFASAVAEFAHELAAAFHYILAPLAILGLRSTRRRLPRPMAVFLGVFVAAYALATICVAGLSGYLAPRHLLPVVIVSLGWAGEGAWMAGMWPAGALRTPRSALRTPPFAPRLAVVLVVLCCLPRTLAPQHASRLGHRQAAAWLAEQANPGDAVLDTRGWSRLYTDLRTYPYDQAKRALRDTRLAYIVLEQPERQFDSRRGQTLRELLAHGGEFVGRFTSGQPNCKTVEIYRWHPQRFAGRPRGERAAN
jgi:hypothetical protein